MSSEINITNMRLLVQLNDDKAQTLLPCMIIVGILMVIGFVGNILVCFVFSTRLKSGTQHFMIVCLAVFDLLSCVIAMPMEIVDMRFYYLFDSVFACKLFRFVNVLCAMCSILMLTAIAMDRFFKVCRPLGRQMTLREAKLCAFISLIIGILLSWPALFIYGKRSAETEISGVVGIDCSTSDSIKNTNYPLVYNCVLFLGFISLMCLFIGIYSKIYTEVKRHKKYMNRIAISTPSSTVVSTIEFNFPSLNSTSEEVYIPESNSSDQSVKQVDILATSFDQTPQYQERNVAFKTDLSSRSNGSSESTNSPNSTAANSDHRNKAKLIPSPLKLFRTVETNDSETDLSTSTSSTPKPKSKVALGKENRTTVIACSVTAVFIFSYLPYLVLVFAAIFDKDFDHELQGSSLAAFNLFLRSYFVNSAANPIIYGVLNYRFRFELKTILKRLKFG